MVKKALYLMISSLAVFIGVTLLPNHPAAGNPPFQEWLQGVEKEALNEGISKKTVGETIDNLQLIPRVVDLDRKQPEMKWTLDDYLLKVVSSERVREGKQRLLEHRDLLEKVAERYGVSERFLVAFWGVETDYGRLGGTFPVVDAIATLAYDGRRSAFFRKELLHALHILDQGHISHDKMTGSWAGAMGQVQFMPSSFRSYAVDFDGDGKIDIWNNLADALASAGNYLKSCGWIRDQTWGRRVRLPEGFDRRLIGIEAHKPLKEWAALGVLAWDGKPLSSQGEPIASVLQPDGPGGSAFVVFENYRVILKWNRSDLFAIAIGLLADEISGNEVPAVQPVEAAVSSLSGG